MKKSEFKSFVKEVIKEVLSEMDERTEPNARMKQHMSDKSYAEKEKFGQSIKDEPEYQDKLTKLRKQNYDEPMSRTVDDSD
jgi:hypothetical protein